MDLKKFFSELKRRNVYKVALTYMITSWLLAQIIALAADTFGAPGWVTKIVFVVLFIGFPIALILAWAFEMSPQGMIRTSSSAAQVNPYKADKKKPFTSNLIIGILIIALIGQFAYNKYSDKKPNLVSNMEKTIAVLPFHNDSPNEENLYFCNGMVEEILNSLQKISELKVKSRTSIEKYRNQSRNLKIIAKELDVNYVLEGSVRKIGEDLRITVQLINAQTGNHLWSETYDGNYTQKIFEFQADIAKKIAASLDAIITPLEEKGINKIPTKNLEAHNLYLNGRFFWNKRTKEGLKMSVLNFEQALALDSTYAMAYAGLADSYTIMAGWGWYPENEGYMKGMELAKKAISFDNSISEAHATLGLISLEHEWNWEKSEMYFIRAITLNPSYATAHQWYAHLLNILQRNNEAREQMDFAIKLNPNAQIMYAQSANIYYNNNEFEKAIEEKNKHIKFINTKSNMLIFTSYVHLGMDKKAIEYLKIMIPNSPNNSHIGMDKKAIEYLKIMIPNSPNNIHRLIDKIYQESGINGVIYWYIEVRKNKKGNLGEFRLYGLVGDRQKTIAYMRKNPTTLLDFRIIADFKLLRSDSAFIAQLQSLELIDNNLKVKNAAFQKIKKSLLIMD